MSNEKAPLVGRPTITVDGGVKEEELNKKKKKEGKGSYLAYGVLVLATTLCLVFVAKNRNGIFTSPSEAANLLRSSIGAPPLPLDAMLIQDISLSSSPKRCTGEGEDPFSTGTGNEVACCDGLKEMLNDWNDDGRQYSLCVGPSPTGVDVSIVIIYAGEYDTGSTATLAKWIAEGASSVEGTTVVVKGVAEATLTDLQNADGIILGSGDYNGSPEPAMFDFLDTRVGSVNLDLVPFGVFATSSGYATGVQDVLTSMARELMTFGGLYVSSGSFHNPQGVAGLINSHPTQGRKWEWHEADPKDDSREKNPAHGLMRHLKDNAKDYGKRIATLATTLHSSVQKTTAHA